MRTVFDFAWGWIKKWWALMSCAAFTILSVCEVYSLHPNEVVIHGTGGLAILFAIIAAFQLWKEQSNRALRAEKLLEERQRITSKDWEEMAQKMQKCCQFIDIQCDWTNDTDKVWSLAGGDHTDMCKAWLSMAGKMLIESPNVKLDTPLEVVKEPDDFIRWCLYLKSKGHFRLSAATALYINSTRHYSGGIQEVNLVSARIFMAFAAREFKAAVDNR